MKRAAVATAFVLAVVVGLNACDSSELDRPVSIEGARHAVKVRPASDSKSLPGEDQVRDAAALRARDRRLARNRAKRAAAQRALLRRLAEEAAVRAYWQASYDKEVREVWDPLAQCETGGNWQDGGQWSGGLGIYTSTWRAFGGLEFAAKPEYATKAQQIAVGQRIRDRYHGYHPWGCAGTVGLL